MGDRHWIAGVLLAFGLTACGDASTCEPEVLPGVIENAHEVGASCSQVTVAQMVYVTPTGRLYIKPGTTLSFTSGAGILVDGGSIKALGTEREPILLTGEVKVRGAWKGVGIRASKDASNTNELSFVTIEYAGSEPFEAADPPDDSMEASGGLTFMRAPEGLNQLHMSYVTLRENKGYGIVANDPLLGAADVYRKAARIADVLVLRITKNSEGAALIVPSFTNVFAYRHNVSGNNFSGNDHDSVVFQDLPLSGQISLEAYGVPYKTNTLTISDGTLLDLSVATLEMDPGAGIHVSGNGILQTRLGTITGSRPNPSDWRGITVNGEEAQLRITGTKILGGPRSLEVTPSTGIDIYRAGSVQISDATISEMNTGIRIAPGVSASVRSSTFKDNSGPAAELGWSSLSLFVDNTITDHGLGNSVVITENVIGSGTSILHPLNPDASYLSGGLSVLQQDSELTLKPGVKLRFKPGSRLVVPFGTIEAVGTAEAPITFTASDNAQGWDGVLVGSSVPNRLEHVIVSHTGSETEPSKVGVEVTGQLSVLNSQFVNNRGTGLKVGGSAVVNGCSTVLFEGNAVDLEGTCAD